MINLGDSNIAIYKKSRELEIINRIHNLSIEAEREAIKSKNGLLIMKGENFRLEGDLVLSHPYVKS